MTKHNRKPLIALLALSAALASPAVFAQDAAATQQQTPTPTTDASGAATQAQPTDQQTKPTDASGTAAGASSQAPGQAAASGGKQGWDDVDTNKDGNISKDEAAANPGLSQVFGQADGDADGKLTKDEYKAFVSKNYGESAKPTK